jgi:hypothetical protein
VTPGELTAETTSGFRVRRRAHRPAPRRRSEARGLPPRPCAARASAMGVRPCSVGDSDTGGRRSCQARSALPPRVPVAHRSCGRRSWHLAAACDWPMISKGRLSAPVPEMGQHVSESGRMRHMVSNGLARDVMNPHAVAIRVWSSCSGCAPRGRGGVPSGWGGPGWGGIPPGWVGAGGSSDVIGLNLIPFVPSSSTGRCRRGC